LVAWWLTGSHSLFAEAIHSLADTINQLILAYGIHKSTQRANVDHPYGYAHMRHVASLISGVGIFCVGAGLSIYHGITGLISMDEINSLYWVSFQLSNHTTES
jgi:zinc transporter 9